MIGISERAIKLLEKNLLYPSNFRPLLEMGEPFRGVVTTEGEETSGRRLSWFRGHSCLVGAVYWIAFLSFVALAM
ncbi:hypothetical protein, partial [Escherichia coli]|uniref:hypothetical protein n=1 Tax=Escherichia coli TaxID=562 RepID=UPI001954686E